MNTEELVEYRKRYREVILPIFLKNNTPPFSEIGLIIYFVSLRKAVCQLWQEAINAKVDLDGCSLSGAAEMPDIDTLTNYYHFYHLLENSVKDCKRRKYKNNREVSLFTKKTS